MLNTQPAAKVLSNMTIALVNPGIHRLEYLGELGTYQRVQWLSGGDHVTIALVNPGIHRLE